MAREKHYFKSKEIAHVWVHKGATYGRCSSSMTFDGNSFYSYSTVIAKRINYKGRVAYIRDVASFSNTTSKHQGDVRRALLHSDKIFRVNIGSYGQHLNFTPQTLRDYYLDKFESFKTDSRYAFKRAYLFLSKIKYLKQAIDVCKYFGLAVAKLEKELVSLEPDIINFTNVASEYETRQKLLREENAKKKQAERIENAINYARMVISGINSIDNLNSYHDDLLESQPDLLAKIQQLRFEKDKQAIEAWQNGSDNHTDYNWPVYLRRENSEMVTTKGARVPIADAEKSFRFVMALKMRGWHRNGETHPIGIYQLDAVNEQGVIAGCHRVSWQEIERFARSQGWTV